MQLPEKLQAALDGHTGEAVAMAARILCAMAHAQGTDRFVAIASAHVDGCLLHGPSGVAFAEKLVAMDGRVAVPTSLNVGAMDLRNPANVRLEEPDRSLAVRLMNAYVAMGCIPSWTCAPYQAGFRPGPGTHVAWAESNAVVFANSVLGARTDRYGDFMDICCALTGYAPDCGLQRPENRFATLQVDLYTIAPRVQRLDAFYPVLGAWLGRVAGRQVAVLNGLDPAVTEDQLKALGAAAASTGAVGLFHVCGVTPEAPDLATALGGKRPQRVLSFDHETLLAERDRLSSAQGDQLDVVAVGSPHFSLDEFRALRTALAGRRVRVPFYACTARHVLDSLAERGWQAELEDAGVTLLVDTCVVVTSVLGSRSGVLMTNSGKFAHYSDSLVNHRVTFGTLEDCVESAIAGRVRRDPAPWGAAA